MVCDIAIEVTSGTLFDQFVAKVVTHFMQGLGL